MHSDQLTLHPRDVCPRPGQRPEDLSPFLRGHQACEVLGHQLPQDLGDARQLGLVTVELGLADEACQLDRVLPRALVEPTQVLGQLLARDTLALGCHPSCGTWQAAGGRGSAHPRQDRAAGS